MNGKRGWTGLGNRGLSFGCVPVSLLELAKGEKGNADRKSGVGIMTG